MSALTPAADCSLPELNARGLHWLDAAENAGDMEGTAGFALLAQAYFQAVTAATAMSMVTTMVLDPAGQEQQEQAAFREMRPR